MSKSSFRHSNNDTISSFRGNNTKFVNTKNNKLKINMYTATKKNSPKYTNNNKLDISGKIIDKHPALIRNLSIKERLKKISSWNINNNHNCILCDECNKCHSCIYNKNSNITCKLKTSNKYSNSSSYTNSTDSDSYNTISTDSDSSYTNSTDLDSYNTISTDSDSSYTNSTNSNSDNCLCIDWKLQIFNNKFSYGINPAVKSNTFNSFFIGQYTGPELELNGITLTTDTSSVFFSEVNPMGEIITAFNLWSYNGIREDYQFGQLKFTNIGELIILTTFVGSITFNNGISISDQNGSVMIGKFFANGNPIWIRQITAKSINDIYFELDTDDDIYICGTFSGTLEISDPESPLITSNLESNMFIGKISNDGITQWLKTATGTGYNTGEGVSYSISDNSIVAIGTYNDTFILNGDTIVNLDNICNMWVAKFNLDGDVINLTTPIHPQSPPNIDISLIDFIDGGQIVSDFNGFNYIVGEIFGQYILGDTTIDVDIPTVFITKLNSDLKFIWIELLQVDIPTNNSYQPKLTLVDDKNTIYLANYGIGDVSYIQTNDNNISFTREGSGSLDQIISTISTSGEWLGSTKICGTVENFSIDIVSNNENVFVIGSHNVNTERSDIYLVKIQT